MTRLTVLLAALVLAFACSESKDEPADSDKEATKTEGDKRADGDKKADDKKADGDSKVGGGLKAPAAAEVKKVAFKKSEVPKELKVQGKLKTGMRFSDKNGDNWVLFSKRVNNSSDFATEMLYVSHVAIGPDGAKELRLVKDKVENCEYDLTLAVDKKSLDVTDLDDDGIGEVNFGYELTCTSDVSPSDYKYLMLEDGEKYIIRGVMKLVLPGEGPIGGKRKIDKSLKEGPKEFLDHAKKRWSKLTVRRM